MKIYCKLYKKECMMGYCSCHQPKRYIDKIKKNSDVLWQIETYEDCPHYSLVEGKQQFTFMKSDLS